MKNEQNLKEAYKKIETKNESANRLLQMVSHDIGNALTIILGHSMISIDKNKGNPVSAKPWKIVQKAGQTILEIIETVRTVQSLENNKTRILLEKVSLNETIEKTNFIFEQTLKNKNIVLVHDIKEDFFFQAEKKSFSNQVFNNIISNAIKFSYPNNKITINAEIIDDEIHITIKDTGIGIPMNILKNLFYSNKKTNRIGTNGEKGTGFGMPLVKSYIEMYNGRIEVESKDEKQFKNNHGTSFHLYLKK